MEIRQMQLFYEGAAVSHRLILRSRPSRWKTLCLKVSAVSDWSETHRRYKSSVQKLCLGARGNLGCLAGEQTP